MKKFLFYLFPLTFLFTAAAIFGFQSAKHTQLEQHTKTSPSSFIKEELFTELPEKYKISSHQGRIALFEIVSGREVLLETYETSLSSLRERDAELLRKGIFFYSHSEAAESLENFIN